MGARGFTDKEGFDAADIDRDIIAERLKESVVCSIMTLKAIEADRSIG